MDQSILLWRKGGTVGFSPINAPPMDLLKDLTVPSCASAVGEEVYVVDETSYLDGELGLLIPPSSYLASPLSLWLPLFCRLFYQGETPFYYAFPELCGLLEGCRNSIYPGLAGPSRPEAVMFSIPHITVWGICDMIASARCASILPECRVIVVSYIVFFAAFGAAGLILAIHYYVPVFLAL